MHLLLINFLLLLVLALLCSCLKSITIKYKIFVGISFLLLLFFRTFVDIQSVPDLEFYRLGYEEIRSISFFEIPLASLSYVKIDEVGFRYLMKICSVISSSFTFFLFIFGLLWLFGYLKVIKNYSPYIILSVILLTIGAYNQSIFVVRQHLAMVVVFLSYKYIINKNFKKYLITVFLAFILHQTAIIALPLYFLYNVRSKKKLLLSLILITVFLYFGFSYLLKTVGGDMLSGYSSYIESDVQTNATGAIIIALELFLYVFILRKHILDEGINKLLFISLAVGLVGSIYGIGFNPTSRLLMYYTSISFLSVPIILKYTKNITIRNVIAFMFVALFAYMAFKGSGFDSLKNFKVSVYENTSIN